MPLMRRRSAAIALGLLLVACTRATKSSTQLSSEEYRSYITFIDRIVFTDGPLDTEKQEMLAAMLSRLSQDTQGGEPTGASQLLDRELATLETSVEAIPVNTPLESTPVRAEWTRIRSAAFSQAAWFRQSSADPELGSPLPRRAAGVVNLENAVTAFGEVLNRVGPAVEHPPGGAARQLAIDSIGIELTRVDSMLAADPGAGINTYFFTARDETRAAIRSLREFLATGLDTLSGSTGRAALDSVQQHLQAAGMAMDHLGGYQ